MNCKPLFLGKNVLGDRFYQKGLFVFFGNRSFDERQFSRCFPFWSACLSRQVHGDSPLVVNTLDPEIRNTPADILVTSLSEVALTTYTADCVPILAFDPETQTIATCHAGWKGIEAGAVSQLLKQLPESTNSTQIWIGPHIGRNSFEVHQDVAERLQGKHVGPGPCVFDHPNDPQKRLVDLTSIVLGILRQSGVKQKNIWVHPADTYSSPSHYSYRREGGSNRLLNFIVKTDFEMS